MPIERNVTADPAAKPKGPSQVLARGVILVVATFVNLAVYAWFYSVMWAWFVEPIAHLHLTKWQIYGLASSISVLHTHITSDAEMAATKSLNESRTETDITGDLVAKLITYTVIRPVFLYVIAYFVHLMIESGR